MTTSTRPAATGGRAAGGRTIDTTGASALTKLRRSRAGTAATDLAKSALRSYGVATAGMRRPPELIVVGAKRGGTTSLWKYLDAHPGILPTFPRAEQIKGTYFFDEEWSRGERWYRSHFPTDHTRAKVGRQLGYDPIAFEASPYYLFHPHAPARGGAWAVLTGDSVHCFGDGILIASAFIADIRLGLVAALSVLAHEVPHHMGDLVVLRQSSPNRRAALVKVSLAGAVTALGGIVGYFLVEQLHDFLPYFLVVASSSFVYVALADLIPQLQKRLSARQTAAQIAWLLVGIAMVTAVSGLAHAH